MKWFMDKIIHCDIICNSERKETTWMSHQYVADSISSDTTYSANDKISIHQCTMNEW